MLRGAGGVLGANFSGGWYHGAGERADRALIFGNRRSDSAFPACMLCPAERRFSELELTEWEDSGKRVARFDVTRESLGVPAGWVFRVIGLQLVVDGLSGRCGVESGRVLRLSDALAWVEGPNAEVARVSGQAIEALLAVTGAMPVMAERSSSSSSSSAVRFAVDLPVGRQSMDVPMRVRAGLAAGGGRPRLMVSFLVSPKGPEGSGGLWESSRLFTAPVSGADEALVPLELPCPSPPNGLSDLLQALVVALPFSEVRVHDMALLLGARELTCIPGTLARSLFERRYNPTGDGTRLCEGWTYLCLPLTVDFECPMMGAVVTARRQRFLCGELDLSTPAVRGGRLAVRVRFEGEGCGFTGFHGDALVQACLLRA